MARINLRLGFLKFLSLLTFSFLIVFSASPMLDDGSLMDLNAKAEGEQSYQSEGTCDVAGHSVPYIYQELVERDGSFKCVFQYKDADKIVTMKGIAQAFDGLTFKETGVHIEPTEPLSYDPHLLTHYDESAKGKTHQLPSVSDTLARIKREYWEGPDRSLMERLRIHTERTDLNHRGTKKLTKGGIKLWRRVHNKDEMKHQLHQEWIEDCQKHGIPIPENIFILQQYRLYNNVLFQGLIATFEEFEPFMLQAEEKYNNDEYFRSMIDHAVEADRASVIPGQGRHNDGKGTRDFIRDSARITRAKQEERTQQAAAQLADAIKVMSEMKKKQRELLSDRARTRAAEKETAKRGSEGEETDQPHGLGQKKGKGKAGEGDSASAPYQDRAELFRRVASVQRRMESDRSARMVASIELESRALERQIDQLPDGFGHGVVLPALRGAGGKFDEWFGDGLCSLISGGKPASSYEEYVEQQKRRYCRMKEKPSLLEGLPPLDSIEIPERVGEEGLRVTTADGTSFPVDQIRKEIELIAGQADKILEESEGNPFVTQICTALKPLGDIASVCAQYGDLEFARTWNDLSVAMVNMAKKAFRGAKTTGKCAIGSVKGSIKASGRFAVETADEAVHPISTGVSYVKSLIDFVKKGIEMGASLDDLIEEHRLIDFPASEAERQIGLKMREARAKRDAATDAEFAKFIHHVKEMPLEEVVEKGSEVVLGFYLNLLKLRLGTKATAKAAGSLIKFASVTKAEGVGAAAQKAHSGMTSAVQELAGAIKTRVTHGKELTDRALNIFRRNPEAISTGKSAAEVIEEIAETERKIQEKTIFRLLRESKPSSPETANFQRETLLGDGKKIVFRNDTGTRAHPITSHGYKNPIDHYNIEIQEAYRGGWRNYYKYHIIVDDAGNVIDCWGKEYFRKGL